MAHRIDFSTNAAIYDQRHGAVLAPDTARDLALQSHLAPGQRVLDIGAGTGRVAIAFAALGYRIVALDPARAMLDELLRKAGDRKILPVVGEGARLPFPAGRFDAVILARVLYVMADWQAVLRQASDVLKPGGCLLHEWGNGEADEAWVQIREKARRLFEEAGAMNPFHPGARSEAEIDDFLSRAGLECRHRLRIGSGPAMALRSFLEKIANGELSYIWNVPQQVRESCLPALRKWSEETLDLNRTATIPRELRWTIYQKP